MLLTGSGDEEFLGLGIAEESQHGIFFHELVETGAELVFVGAGLGLDGEGDSGLGQLHAGILNGGRLVAESIAGQSVFQFGDSADVAGVQFGDGNRGLALHGRDVGELFQRRTAEVLQGGIVLENSGENFEVGDASGEGIGNGFENVKGNGFGVGLVALGSVAVTAGDGLSLHPLVFGGGRSVVDDEVHDAIGADIAQA